MVKNKEKREELLHKVQKKSGISDYRNKNTVAAVGGNDGNGKKKNDGDGSSSARIKGENIKGKKSLIEKKEKKNVLIKKLAKIHETERERQRVRDGGKSDSEIKKLKKLKDITLLKSIDSLADMLPDDGDDDEDDDDTVDPTALNPDLSVGAKGKKIQKLTVNEVQRFNSVINDQGFSQNPMAALREHIQASILASNEAQIKRNSRMKEFDNDD